MPGRAHELQFDLSNVLKLELLKMLPWKYQLLSDCLSCFLPHTRHAY